MQLMRKATMKQQQGNNGKMNPTTHKVHGKHSAVMMQRALSSIRENKLNLAKCFCCNHQQRQDVHQQHRPPCDVDWVAEHDETSSATCASTSRQNKSWDADMEYFERQDRVKTLDLFRYASRREVGAILLGILFMVYAASWQPISVFILAIMASLMGQYSKQMSWLLQLNGTAPISSSNLTSTAAGQQPLLSGLSNLMAPGGGGSGHGRASSTPLMNPLEAYESYSFLASLHSLVMPIFDVFSSSSSSSSESSSSGGDNANSNLSTSGHTPSSRASEQARQIQAAVHDILDLESQQFLRKSFEINGSAFVLALTQLLAFFLGLSLITWAAKKQASRIKVLYFNSCLHQEVTWFEAIDSASGSGSSLNGLVEKYEDGIGMKFALLCYFLGHVTLFALTAFYQMFSLAAFCMPFVLTVGLVIAYLSDRQAAAIGQHALFAKRSMQLAEEILAAIRTVFAFNGQQKELTRYSLSFEPVYRKSLVKHLYTALNTSLSKFSIFACFAAYCFYAKRLFPPHSQDANPANKSTILAVMRGAEVSIVNILISIPFMEALQQSKGSIARIYAAIERRSRIDAASGRGLRPDYGQHQPPRGAAGRNANGSSSDHAAAAAAAVVDMRQRKASNHLHGNWQPSISFRMVQFGYADRSGPTRRRSTLPYLNLPLSPSEALGAASNNNSRSNSGSGAIIATATATATATTTATTTTAATITGSSHPSNAATGESRPNVGARRQSLLDELADQVDGDCSGRRPSAAIRRALGQEAQARGHNKRVLNYFNLEIKAGQSVALVGPSGSGKSTVLALVQRLYDIAGGQLLVGQHNIKDLSVGWLRNQIGVVAQEPRLFDMTIAENIMLGLSSDDADLARLAADRDCLNRDTNDAGAGDKPDKEVLRLKTRIMQQVVEAAQAAGAHQFIVRLPSGYATRVGSAGVQLSGGQKQRIAIARALIRKPKILLLDECTSALDTESEAQVQAAIRRASSLNHLTTLIVAHRLETIKHVDLIAVVSEGQVVECGSHDELMRAPEGQSIYRRMYLEQLRALGVHKRQHRLPVKWRPRLPDEMIRIAVQAPDGTQMEEADDSLDKRQTDRLADRRVSDESSAEPIIKAATTTRTKSPKLSTSNQDYLRPEKEKEKLEEKLEEKEGEEDRQKDDGNNNKDDSCAPSSRYCEHADDQKDNQHESHDDHDDKDSCSSISGCSLASTYDSAASSGRAKASIGQLWQFIEMPKWTALASVVVCLLAGLILPLNLIAHSYLFSVFAYNELEQIGEYLQVFGLLILSFSTFVFICSFLQVLLPGFVGEKLSARLSVKTMDSLLQKPMFYFDMNSNSAGSLCHRFNNYIGNLQAIAGTRAATILEASSTLCAGAIFGFGQSVALSMFCLSFAIFVLITTIIESKICEREASLQRHYDAQLAHLMADALANIKTIASLNKEQFFIDRFRAMVVERERGSGPLLNGLRNLLTSLKFVMPALSWSASMYYGCCLLVAGQIDLQTIFIVCPVVLFAVNDTFRALVFLPELLKARQSIRRLHRMNVEFSPQILQALTFSQQLEQQHQLHLEQQSSSLDAAAAQLAHLVAAAGQQQQQQRRHRGSGSSLDSEDNQVQHQLALSDKPKKSISFAPELLNVALAPSADEKTPARGPQPALVNRRLSNLAALPSYMSARRKSSRLNSLVPRATARGHIQFKQVDFAYPNRPSALVLDQFTLTIEPGECVALVGGSGSGKSTTVTILEKFYDYHAGEVRLDGRDLRLVEPNWVRAQVGLVSQEPCLLGYSIADNIRYGDNSRFVPMDEVVEAARTANIHDFIMSLPDQYETQLASSAYSGSQLSGGQRQRICIARALVRRAPILVFDEATSALDQRSEQVVQDALARARRGRTCLVIAHRLATIRDADKIVVMRDGRLVECGKHQQLLARPHGHYRSLWERQEGVAGAPDGQPEHDGDGDDDGDGHS